MTSKDIPASRGNANAAFTEIVQSFSKNGTINLALVNKYNERIIYAAKMEMLRELDRLTKSGVKPEDVVKFISESVEDD